MANDLFRRIRRWGGAHPFCFYLAPLVAWILFIAWGSLAPPDQLLQFDFALADKVEHAFAYAVLAVLLLRVWVRQGPLTPAACLLALAVASLWGVYLEFMQRLTGDRTFDLTDAVANTSGALLGLALWAALSALHRAGDSGDRPAPSRFTIESEDQIP